MSSFDFIERAVSMASNEFIRGFLIGQVTCLMIIFLLVKFLFFHGPESTRLRIQFSAPSLRENNHEGCTKKQKDEGSECSESCEWLNVLMKNVLLRPLREALLQPEILSILSEKLNSASNKIDLLGPVNLNSFHLPPNNDPRILWIKRGGESTDCTNIKIRLEWRKAGQIEVESSLLIRWPKEVVASLPFSFTFSLEHFALSLDLHIHDDGVIEIRMGKEDDFEMELEIHSLIGARSKLDDVPRVLQLVKQRIRRAIKDRLVGSDAQPIIIASTPSLAFFIKQRIEEWRLTHCKLSSSVINE